MHDYELTTGELKKNFHQQCKGKEMEILSKDTYGERGGGGGEL